MSDFPAINMTNCSGSCPEMCNNGGGKYQDSQSKKYENDTTIFISCYYGKNEFTNIVQKLNSFRPDRQL